MRKQFLFTLLLCILCLCSCSKDGSFSQIETARAIPTTSQAVDEESREESPEVSRQLELTSPSTEPEECESPTEESVSLTDKTEISSPQAHLKFRLDVPAKIQEQWNYCAPTTVQMILAYKGIEIDQATLAREMLTDEAFGTHNDNAIKILNKYLFGYEIPAEGQAGYRLATVSTADPHSEEMRLFKERLRQNIKDGYPMYYTIDNARIYDDAQGEHNVVGIGYKLDEKGEDIAYIYYIDPSYTQQDPVYGGLKIITPEQLFYAMLTCVEPNYGW